MSPIAEKLAAVLADWDEMVNSLAEAKKQLVAKEEAIVNLQQQYIRQASEITTLRGKVSTLELQVADAVLTATDPDDVKLLNQIEAAYATLAPRNNSVDASSSKTETTSKTSSSTPAQTAAQIAVNLSPPIASPADVPVPSSSSKSASSESNSGKPSRSSSPSSAKPAPSLRDVVFKLVE